MSCSLSSSAIIETATACFLRSVLNQTQTRSPGVSCSSLPHQPAHLTSASTVRGQTLARLSPSINSVTLRRAASTALSVANRFGRERRNSAVPATSLILSLIFLSAAFLSASLIASAAAVCSNENPAAWNRQQLTNNRIQDECARERANITRLLGAVRALTGPCAN